VWSEQGSIYPAQIKPKVPSDGLNKKAVWF
jgi:hypothetical protein